MSRRCRPSNVNLKDKEAILKGHRYYQLQIALDKVFDAIDKEKLDYDVLGYSQKRSEKVRACRDF